MMIDDYHKTVKLSTIKRLMSFMHISHKETLESLNYNLKSALLATHTICWKLYTLCGLYHTFPFNERVGGTMSAKNNSNNNDKLSWAIWGHISSLEMTEWRLWRGRENMHFKSLIKSHILISTFWMKSDK